MMKMMMKSRIILVPYPAQGHVTPMIHLAFAFLHHTNFKPVIVIPDHIHSLIHSHYDSDDGISFEPIPDGLAADHPRDFFSISYAMENNMPAHLERIISDGGVACVIVDLLASWAIDVARRCTVPVAGFWPAMLATYNLIAAIPEMMQQGLISEFGSPQHEGALWSLRGQPVMKSEHLPWLVGDSAARKSRFAFWVRALTRFNSLQCLLLNSFPQESSSNQCNDDDRHHVFQIGPLLMMMMMMMSRSKIVIKNPSFWEEDRSCMSWLDKQERGSVVYVSFGSWVGPIGEDKMCELALGLEATNKPFLWALKGSDSWRKGLPFGFLERTGGKVVSWAPQREVLRHEAIGCYLTHCGWNSTIEAIQYCRKPLLCCPIAGDQFVNCTYIVKVWGIGVKMDGMGRGDVERGVKRVMMDQDHHHQMQQRLMELKQRVMSKESCSTARASLQDFIHHHLPNSSSIATTN